MVERNISRIFPIYAHRFVLIDAKENILLSMHGNDIIFWADNISKGLVKDIFGSLIENAAVFESDFINPSNVKFWLEI